MTSPRGTTNTNIRGSAESRRRSKRALLARDGDGSKAPCWECGTLVTFETMIRDKIKAGRDGGRYTLANLRVHCRLCSEAQGRRMALETRRFKMWAKQGLRRSRVSPAGFRSRSCWYVHLETGLVGRVHLLPGGEWVAERWLAVIGEWMAITAAHHRTMRGALYALLVECTINTKGKAA